MINEINNVIGSYESLKQQYEETLKQLDKIMADKEGVKSEIIDTYNKIREYCLAEEFISKDPVVIPTYRVKNHKLQAITDVTTEFVNKIYNKETNKLNISDSNAIKLKAKATQCPNISIRNNSYYWKNVRLVPCEDGWQSLKCSKEFLEWFRHCKIRFINFGDRGFMSGGSLSEIIITLLKSILRNKTTEELEEAIKKSKKARNGTDLGGLNKTLAAMKEQGITTVKEAPVILSKNSNGANVRLLYAILKYYNHKDLLKNIKFYREDTPIKSEEEGYENEDI